MNFDFRYLTPYILNFNRKHNFTTWSKQRLLRKITKIKKNDKMDFIIIIKTSIK